MSRVSNSILVRVPLFCIQFAYGCTNFVGGIAASRPHRRTDSTVRPTPGTTDVRYEYSWYEVPYWYEYLLPACMHAGRQAGRQASRTNLERIPNESRTNPEHTPSDNEGSRIYMYGCPRVIRKSAPVIRMYSDIHPHYFVYEMPRTILVRGQSVV